MLHKWFTNLFPSLVINTVRSVILLKKKTIIYCLYICIFDIGKFDFVKFSFKIFFFNFLRFKHSFKSTINFFSNLKNLPM